MTTGNPAMTLRPPRTGEHHRSRNVMQQRKQLILWFVHLFRSRHQGISPSTRQIAKGIGYGDKSGGSAGGLVNELIREGWLRREIPGSRTLVLTHPWDSLYYPIEDADCQLIETKLKNAIARLK